MVVTRATKNKQPESDSEPAQKKVKSLSNKKPNKGNEEQHKKSSKQSALNKKVQKK
jgi:hypothetical protein